MKPFIYQFLELPKKGTLEDLNLLEYSDKLNLSVIKGTSIPAINTVSLGTTTFTKSDSEGSDSDADTISSSSSYGTMTQTRQMIEGSDSDFSNTLRNMMDTSSITLVSYEASDSDRDKLSMMLSTRTLTETKETTDSDK